MATTERMGVDVDVLGVMDAVIEKISAGGIGMAGLRVGDARAAVAELVAADLAMLAALNDAYNIEPQHDDDDSIYDTLPTNAVAAAYFKTRAALAPFSEAGR